MAVALQPDHRAQARTPRALLALNGADVGLQTPQGELRCNVSRERISRMSRDSFKDMRERPYADEFVQVLSTNGARVRP